MKRIIDIVLSIIGLIVLAPLILTISIIIKLADPGAILFKQERMGIGFKPFTLYKFRSMVQSPDWMGPNVTSAGDVRITPVGRFLRKTKLDELPQLINVLIGDMSIVGPRPEVRKYVEMFKDEYIDILSVRPGITDNAAIEFRDEEELLAKYDDPEKGYIEEILPAKLKHYKKYVLNQSIISDMIIILKTIKVVAGGRGGRGL